MPIIYMDVDGVLVGAVEKNLQRVNETEGTSYTLEDLTDFDHMKCEALLPKHRRMLVEYWNDPRLYDDLEPYPSAEWGLGALRQSARVVAVGSPTLYHVDSKLKFLTERLEFGVRDIVIIRDKSLLDGNGVLMIDDHMSNLLTFSGERICVARPWNALWDENLGLHTDDWEEIVREAQRIVSAQHHKYK